jgi:hypothetical protein
MFPDNLWLNHGQVYSTEGKAHQGPEDFLAVNRRATIAGTLSPFSLSISSGHSVANSKSIYENLTKPTTARKSSIDKAFSIVGF